MTKSGNARANAPLLTLVRACGAIALALLVASCATPLAVTDQRAGPPAPGSVLHGTAIATDVEDRILALDPLHVSDDDVRHTLALGPTPRIFKLHGGIFPTRLIMESFADFLIRMGYPERAVRDPGTGDTSHSPYESSIDLAGEVAWCYEHEGVRPMMIGHSQGGMQLVKVLYELDGKFDDRIDVFNPTDAICRGSHHDCRPADRQDTPHHRPQAVVCVGRGRRRYRVAAAQPMEHGEPPVRHTGHRRRFHRLRTGRRPDRLDGPRTRDLYAALGTANVRNVRLPAAYSHLYVVNTARLGAEPNARAWINAWTPALTGKDPPAGIDQENIQWAADVWYSIKQHWVIEAQRFVRARRALPGH